LIKGLGEFKEKLNLKQQERVNVLCIMRLAYAPVPPWFFDAIKGDVKELEKQRFDPNACLGFGGERRSPLKYVIAMRCVRGAETLLTMGARVTPALLAYGKESCYHHIDEKRFSYEGNCCLILEMLQHAHELPPRLCATTWSFAQMSGVWRDLIQPVVEERMCKEEL
jgi:hypothetical protein